MKDFTGDAIAAAILAATLSVVAPTGLDPAVVAAAAAGGVLGEPAARETGMLQKTLVFIAATFAGALFGTLMAIEVHKGARLYAEAWALGIAVGMQPLLTAFTSMIPLLATALRDRVVAGLRGLFGGGSK